MVASVITVHNFVLDVHGLFAASLDFDLEFVTAGLTVLSVVVSSLDDELDLSTYSVAFLNSWSVAERHEGASVHEEAERHEGCGQIASLD